MKKTFIAIVHLFLLFFANAQNMDLNGYIPSDKAIHKGVLDNGLTYYIYHTDVVEGAASYYIIQNVGSILENDDQRGLAHFLEHMAFNGTQNFEGKGILNTLQKHGAVFGKDINAFTSFDETVYNLSNIPTKDNLIDTCLLVLHDWSNYLSLLDEEIDAERGVIKEEWRTSQTGQRRMQEAGLPTAFNYSKYSERLPIGTMEIVENFDYKALRDFYHDWYRTDLQAIAVIGDVDVDKVEVKIKKRFSSIPAVKNARERFTVKIPENKELLYNLAMDPEISTSSIHFGIRHAKTSSMRTVGELKESLLESLVMAALTSRIREKTQDPNASFLASLVQYGSITRANNSFDIYIAPKPNRQQEAFKEVVTEVERAVKHGFLNSEIEREKSKIFAKYEREIAGKNDRAHFFIATDIRSNYNEQHMIPDIEKEYEIAKAILGQITQEEVSSTLNRLYTKKNRYVNVTGVRGENNLSKQEVVDIITEVETDEGIGPYTETLGNKTLMSNVNINVGNITKEEKNKELNSSTYTLSNGIKVYYKYSDREKDQVTLNAISHGGISLLEDENVPSAEVLFQLVSISGVGDYSAADLQKVLAGKNVMLSPGLDETTERLTGNSTTKDVETMLQLAHLYLVNPRFDEKSFEVLQEANKSILQARQNSINEKINDSITTTLYGTNHPRKRIMDEGYIDEIGLDKIKSIYHDRFTNAADFEFYIVGDVSGDQLKPLLEKYIASIPTEKAKENFKDLDTNWKSKTIDRDVFLKMEDAKANVNIAYKVQEAYTPKSKIINKAIGDLMQLRLTERLREQEGGVYSPRIWGSMFKEPKSIAYLTTSFDCNPDLADKLATIVHEELEKLSKGIVIEADFEKTRINFLKEREQFKNYNRYDMDLLTTYYRDGYNESDRKNFEDIVEKMSVKDIKELAQKLRKGQKFEIIFKPES